MKQKINIPLLHVPQGFQSGPVPGTFTRLRSCIVPAEITEPPKISGGQNHKYDVRFECENSAIDVIINFLWKIFHKPIHHRTCASCGFDHR